MKKNCPKIAKMLKKADPLQGFPSINRGLFKGATRGNRGSAAGRSLFEFGRCEGGGGSGSGEGKERGAEGLGADPILG